MLACSDIDALGRRGRIGVADCSVSVELGAEYVTAECRPTVVRHSRIRKHVDLSVLNLMDAEMVCVGLIHILHLIFSFPNSVNSISFD